MTRLAQLALLPIALPAYYLALGAVFGGLHVYASWPRWRAREGFDRAAHGRPTITGWPGVDGWDEMRSRSL